MASIEIPLPEFGFDEIAKDKAKYMIRHLFHHSALMQYFTGSNPGLDNRIKILVLELEGEYERLICVIDLLCFLSTEELLLKNNTSFNVRDSSEIATGFNKIRYVLYNLAKHNANYTFDKDTFSNEEVKDISSKLDIIIYTLSKLELGQEAIYDDVKAQITQEFESLRSLPVLGKKTFYQLVFGKIATFTGNKIADEFFKILIPQIINLLVIHAPHLVDEIQKLIG